MDLSDKNTDRQTQQNSENIFLTATEDQIREIKLQKNIAVLEEAYGQMDDKSIWNKFKSGDEPVFTFIYYKYFAMLCRYGSQFIADKDQVKDHIHDLFIELSDRRERLSSTTSIKFYLMKCLKNRMIAARKKKKIFFKDDNAVKGFDFEISFSIEHTLIHDQEVKERNQRLNKAIQKLSKRQRVVVYYYYFEELSMEETMELMDCRNVKSVQNLLYRAIHCLKEYLSIIAIVFYSRLDIV